ncbi:MAG: SdpI family protein [Dissulfurispiraceae bacterium]|jgi:hypothetical protein
MMIHSPFIVPAVIFLVASIPLILGVVPKNRWYGIRTAKTMADDRVWYSANRFGGWMLTLSSLIYLSTATLLPYSKSAQNNFSIWAVHLAAFGLPLAINIFLTLRYIRNL